jgi:7-cyano-7-deazaguanine synthase
VKAVVVLSGGLDSTTCMGIAHDEGYEIVALTFAYGQRHAREVEQARKVAAHFGAEHHVVTLPFLQEIGGSALTDHSIEVPVSGIDSDTIPSTYVPARNLIFLSLATAFAETHQAQAIYIGVSAVDYSGYPDCRPEFIAAFNETIRRGTKEGNIQVIAPLVHLSKAETIRRGLALKVPYHLTTSCYQGGEEACGVCDSCRLRLQGFEENGVADPIPYKAG